MKRITKAAPRAAALAGATGKWARKVEYEAGAADKDCLCDDCALCDVVHEQANCEMCPLKHNGGSCVPDPRSVFNKWVDATAGKRPDAATRAALVIQFVLYALADGAGDWSFMDRR